MIKILLLMLSIMIAQAEDIEISHAQHKAFGKTLEVNAKIIQLSDQKQQIVSRLGGHLEQYFVRTGEQIKKGDKIAQIQSLELSKMSASFIALKKEMKAVKRKLYSTQKLYRKGLSSQQDVNTEEIHVASVEAKLNALKTQFDSLDIESDSLTKATDSFTIHAHADGKIEKLLVTLHANLDAQTPIISLVQESGYYAEAYLPVNSALKMGKNINAAIMIGEKTYPCKYISLLPQVDEITGQAKILFWIESAQDLLLLNAYAKMQIEHTSDEHFVAVKKSALSMFEGEWVIFVPHEEEGHEEHEQHKEEEEGAHHTMLIEAEHDDHDMHDHEEHAQHDEDGHDAHEEEEEAPYAAKVIKQLHSFGDFVAVLGIDEGAAYVSDGVYFVKSMLLKSKLGGHGH